MADLSISGTSATTSSKNSKSGGGGGLDLSISGKKL
jgi:hypothetical protein